LAAVLTVAAKTDGRDATDGKNSTKGGEPRKLDQENKARIHQPQMDAGVFVQKQERRHAHDKDKDPG